MGTEITNYNAEYAKLAQEMASEEQSSGQFITTSGGVLKFGDEELPGNQMLVVILDAVREKTYYTEKFDPDNPMPPTCYAFGRGNDAMAPHESMQSHQFFQPQSEECDSCPMNVFGSADTGRGKACQDRRRLAVLPAGFFQKKPKSRDYDMKLFDDPKHFQSADIAFFKIPVTSVKEWSKYVTQLSAQLTRPPFGVITRVFLENDPKYQFKVHFELVEELPNELAPIVFARREEAQKSIITSYSPPDADQQAARAKTGMRRLKGRK